MTPETKNKIQRILNYIESGSQNGNYAAISLYKDGPNQIKQITFGKSQTTEWGNLNKLISLYVEKDGKFADELKPYLQKIGKVSLVGDANLLSLLKGSGLDPIMQESQDEFFDEHYWKPAVKWFESNKFTLPLSMLVIYDSFIHSGSILTFLRNKFSASIPSKGGDEKEWITSYLNVRHEWLKNHSNPILRKTIYRTRDMLAAVEKENWDLEQVYYCNGENIA
jgi:chitosanase